MTYFIDNGVRPAQLFSEYKKLIVKWHGCKSVPKYLNGGGPQGATICLLKYLSQSNHNADCVEEEDRYKFVDDLTILEIVNLLLVGITSFNVKYQVPNDIPAHNQYIPPGNLKSKDNMLKLICARLSQVNIRLC